MDPLFIALETSLGSPAGGVSRYLFIYFLGSITRVRMLAGELVWLNTYICQKRNFAERLMGNPIATPPPPPKTSCYALIFLSSFPGE